MCAGAIVQARIDEVVIGSMNSQRISDVSKASGITLSKEEWYEIYKAAGNKLP